MRAEFPQTTIAAIATGTGGGVGIIRVSGPHAEDVGRRLCVPWPAAPVSHHLYLGTVRDIGGQALDQVLFCLMRGPRSFTGEDVLEIHGHGGEQNLSRLLAATLEAGAVMAGPGDFSRRAFLAGKLDLTQAEGLVATIGAQSQEALRHAQRHLGGEMGRRIEALRRGVGEILGTVEALLDFPDLDDKEHPSLLAALQVLQAETAALAGSFLRGGRAMGQGLRISLVGRANAGKSSLVNALAGGERILVHHQPGTTRDYVEVRTSFGDLSVILVDTAGYRDEGTELEEAGWRLSRSQHGEADLVWLVVDGSQGLDGPDEDLLYRLGAGAPYLVVWNKVDRQACRQPPSRLDIVGCSALNGWGLDELRQRSLEQVISGLAPGELIVMSARQATLLSEAAQLLAQASANLERAQLWDIVATDLRAAAGRLGDISGGQARPDVLDAVFSQFCIGK